MKFICKVALIASTLAIVGVSAAKAEVPAVNLMSQYGIGYLQLTIMKHNELVQKHLKKVGLNNTKVNWATLGSGSSANDALLSGSLHFASGGTGPALILWDRTKGNLNVKGVAALSSMPMAGAGSSVQTIYLQMAAAKEFGMDNYKKFNPLMVNLAHPVGLQSLLSGAGGITAQFTSPPFWNRAILDPKIRIVLNSYDTMGGPNTFLMVWAAEKFRTENPKTFGAVMAALIEATAFINKDMKAAAEIYVAEGGGKEKVEDILAIMQNPLITFENAPQRILPFAQFMNDIGTLKNRPQSWKELFFENIHNLNGS